MKRCSVYGRYSDGEYYYSTYDLEDYEDSESDYCRLMSSIH